MNHDLVLLIYSLSENFVELHFIKMEHHNILRFLFVCGLEKVFLVGGLGVEDQQNGLIEVALSLHFMSFRALGVKRKQNKPSVDKENFKVKVFLR